MQLSQTLKSGKLIKRYKRFFADLEYENNIITAHCPNPGSMTGLNQQGQDVLFSTTDNTKRKLKYTLEFVRQCESWVGVNTQYPNKLVAEALRNKIIPNLSDYSEFKPEFNYDKGIRYDFLLTGLDKKQCIVEVKNVQLRRNVKDRIGLAEFPDSVTDRGSKHLNHLSLAISKGYRCMMLYVVQRTDCEKFSIASDIDPVYVQNFNEAVKTGVEIEVWGCDISHKEIKLSKQLKLI